MFVTVSGIRILLPSANKQVLLTFGELNSFLRTILYAGKAKFAIALCFYALRSHFIITFRTYIHTHGTTDTTVGYGEVILTAQQEAFIGIYTRPSQKLLMLRPFFFRHRLMPTAFSGYVS